MSRPSLEEFSLILKKAGVIELDMRPGGGARLKHHEGDPIALLSPYKFNFATPEHPTRPGPVTQELLWTISEMLWREVRSRRPRFDAIAGIPRAGEPIAEALAALASERLGGTIPLLYFEKIEGPDGAREIGPVRNPESLRRGSLVLLVDDVVTRAHNKLEAIRRLEEAGFTVMCVLVVIDREEGARYSINRATGWKVELNSVLTARRLFDALAFEYRWEVWSRIQAYLDQTRDG